MKPVIAAVQTALNAARAAVDAPLAFAECFTFTLATGTVLAQARETTVAGADGVLASAEVVLARLAAAVGGALPAVIGVGIPGIVDRAGGRTVAVRTARPPPNLTLSGGGQYNWQMRDANGAAGTGYDLVDVVTGPLNLSGLSAGSQCAFAQDNRSVTL